MNYKELWIRLKKKELRFIYQLTVFALKAIVQLPQLSFARTKTYLMDGKFLTKDLKLLNNLTRLSKEPTLFSGMVQLVSSNSLTSKTVVKDY